MTNVYPPDCIPRPELFTLDETLAVSTRTLMPKLIEAIPDYYQRGRIGSILFARSIMWCFHEDRNMTAVVEMTDRLFGLRQRLSSAVRRKLRTTRNYARQYANRLPFSGSAEFRAIGQLTAVLGIWGQNRHPIDGPLGLIQLIGLCMTVCDVPRFESLQAGGSRQIREIGAIDRILRMAMSIEWDDRWNSEQVVGIARAMNDSRDWNRAPILADALQDQDCQVSWLLDALRDPQFKFCAFRDMWILKRLTEPRSS